MNIWDIICVLLVVDLGCLFWRLYRQLVPRPSRSVAVAAVAGPPEPPDVWALLDAEKNRYVSEAGLWLDDAGQELLLAGLDRNVELIWRSHLRMPTPPELSYSVLWIDERTGLMRSTPSQGDKRLS